jgi:hypothetical protein
MESGAVQRHRQQFLPDLCGWGEKGHRAISTECEVLTEGGVGIFFGVARLGPKGAGKSGIRKAENFPGGLKAALHQLLAATHSVENLIKFHNLLTKLQLIQSYY